jgi:hypothetical protein
VLSLDATRCSSEEARRGQPPPRTLQKESTGSRRRPGVPIASPRQRPARWTAPDGGIRTRSQPLSRGTASRTCSESAKGRTLRRGARPGFPKEEPRGGGWNPRAGGDPWSTPHGGPPCPSFRSTAEEALPRKDAGDSARALCQPTPEGIAQPKSRRDTVRGKLPAARPRGVVPKERPAPVRSGPGEAPCRTTPDGAARGQLPRGEIQ